MKRFTGIKAVTFDVGNTLIEPWPSVGHVYAEVAAEHGHRNLSAEKLEQRFRIAFRARSGLVNSQAEWSVIVDETFAGLMPRPPSESFFPELYQRFAHSNCWRIFEDVLPTLEALHQRSLRLSVLSNWDDRLHSLLDSLALADWFDAIIVSCEVGASKPDSAIFDAAVDKLGVPAHSVLHVGDDFERDVAGARAAGFGAVQVVRKKQGRADGQIKSLTDLLALV